MSVQLLSPNSVAVSPVYVNPQIKSDQATAVPQVSQNTQKADQVAKTDTVTISPQAVQKLASDGDTQAKEVTESGAEKAAEAVKRKA
jgi:hypothetical protein